MNAPLLVALCGAPKVGKTTVAEILAKRFQACIVDDGACLREAAVPLFGGLPWDYHSQDGKARSKTICGKEFTNRQLLGDLGNLLERYYGDQFMPERAMSVVRYEIDRLNPAPVYVFPSVRKNQGITYRNAGGYVIEIVRDGCVPVHDFDHYDQSLVTYTVPNNDTLWALEDRIVAMMADLGLPFPNRSSYP